LINRPIIVTATELINKQIEALFEFPHTLQRRKLVDSYVILLPNFPLFSVLVVVNSGEILFPPVGMSDNNEAKQVQVPA
jgi:hypothetical protein